MPVALTNPPPRPIDLNALIGDLRQKPPFRYIDKITWLAADFSEVSGKVTLLADDRYLPDEAIEPIMIEALAQLSSVLLRYHTGSTSGGVMTGIESADFFGRPDLARCVSLSVAVEAAAFPIFTLAGEVRQDGETLCDALFSTRSNAGDLQ